MLDIYSRYVVGWMVATQESASLARTLIWESCTKQRIDSGQLTLHADRGPSMKSKSPALLLADLGVAKSHSRPHVRDDNPYSESQFKTLKHRPEFPSRFGSIQRCSSFLPGVLPLVQHRTQILRNRTAHAPGRSLPKSGVQTPGTGSGLGGRLRSYPRRSGSTDPNRRTLN